METYNTHLQDWLALRGCFPVYQKGNYAEYWASPQLSELLDTYYIQTVCIKNIKGT